MSNYKLLMKEMRKKEAERSLALPKTKKFRKLRAGVTVYIVRALGMHTYIEEVCISGLPYLGKTGTWFVPYTFYYKHAVGGKVTSSFSLLDANVFPNAYNNHRLFFSRKKAISYSESIQHSRQYHQESPKQLGDGIDFECSCDYFGI